MFLASPCKFSCSFSSRCSLFIWSNFSFTSRMTWLTHGTRRNYNPEICFAQDHLWDNMVTVNYLSHFNFSLYRKSPSFKSIELKTKAHLVVILYTSVTDYTQYMNVYPLGETDLNSSSLTHNPIDLSYCLLW